MKVMEYLSSKSGMIGIKFEEDIESSKIIIMG